MVQAKQDHILQGRFFLKKRATLLPQDLIDITGNVRPVQTVGILSPSMTNPALTCFTTSPSFLHCLQGGYAPILSLVEGICSQ